MTQMITVPRAQYIQMVATFTTFLVEENDKDAPRTTELRDSLLELTSAAKAAGLQLDDAFVAQNETAQRVRNAIDGIMPEFKMLMERAEKRVALTTYFKEQIEQLPQDPDVSVPLNDTLVLTGLAQAA